MVGESSRSIQQTQCFKCRGYGHVLAQCLSKSRTLIIETHSDSDQDDLDEIVHDPARDAWEDDLDVDQVTSLDCVLSMHSPSVDYVDKITCHLNVVRCALAKPKENDDWRRTSIFQTLTKIDGKNCRVIIDSGSCQHRRLMSDNYREIENPKKELIDNKEETIHIYIIKVMGMGLLGRSPIAQ